MKALIYVMKRTLINSIKRLKEKPQKAIGPVFVVIWLVIMFLPKGRKVADGDGMPAEVFVSIFLIVIAAMFLYALYSGSKSVTSKFDMSDVNLLFVSPIRPQTIMIYGIVKKVAVEVLASLYILYQIPNLLSGNNVPVLNQVLLMVNLIIFQVLFCNILKLFIFALCFKFERLGVIIRSFIKALLLLIAVGIAALFMKGNGLEALTKFAQDLTYSSHVKFIPVFGWLKEIAHQTLIGINAAYGLYMFMILATSGLLLYITYTMDMDFYEDMLSSAENNEVIKDAKAGIKVTPKQGAQKNIFNKVFKEVKLNLKGSYGAKVLFLKHINEYRKRSFIFFINTYSLVLLAVSILAGVFLKEAGIKLIFIIFSGFLIFSAGLGAKLYIEIDKAYIYLLPDSPNKKLFYGSASSFIKLFTDSLILFLPLGILGKASIIEILLCIICYVALGGMLSFSGLCGFRAAQFLGFTSQISQGIFFMFFQFFLAVPVLIIVMLGTKFFTDFNGYLIYLLYLIYSLGAGALFFFGGAGIFNDMEFRA